MKYPESIEAESSLVLAKSWGNRRMGIDSFIGTVYSGVIKSFETRGR